MVFRKNNMSVVFSMLFVHRSMIVSLVQTVPGKLNMFISIDNGAGLITI